MCRGLDSPLRQAAADYAMALLLDHDIEVITESDELFLRGLSLYRDRPDKRYSLTDCMAMELSKERGIVDVLTYDRDFIREGFRALLREEPA